jgi:hypothetical protein
VPTVNRILGAGFDAWFWLLQPLPATVTLALFAAVTAVGLLLVIRTSSDQHALAAVKRQMHADLLEIRLFNDDLAAMFRAERAFLRHNATYLRLSLVPSLWTIIPVVIAMPHLEAYFGYRGPAIGQSILVTAQLASHADPEARLDLPAGVRAETPPVWVPALQQVVWRLTADANGDYRLRLRIGAESFDKMLSVSDRLTRRSPTRTGAGLLDGWAHPSEGPLPTAAPVQSIRIEYPDRDFDILGWRVSWFVVFVGEVILLGALLKRPLRVNL